ncbi:MAG: dihydroorotate dehydrogenase electron transfer subunit [marine benthic group bacterium]|jgi:dihydroorotate dehydrogenase electron transfer subunit|nr:dihydroorotate dehydrogenase electron transfer subunit [Gemmatimonadota bacterium]MCL7961509.1 dihydroorotate dehydrogenase electron transfer subunit [Candidatus Carthagonibacter metallireducens]MCL7957969.1 dihydroorotate dehydrogenase electron transfer subunit [Gemmatimonadota bacterium]MCL7964853.1 dihydroorotate dehydrogenase electron transfer subunit [Gemmatimonadota bacterium]MCL7980044.1 dihydroorotate dehydrogenase electron transfer subunit [Gemmatimonadota bacterium]
MNAPIRDWAEVREIRRAADETWWVELDSPAIAGRARPGQFVMVGLGVEQVAAPFLPRPFSVGLAGPDRTVGLLLREFGAGTRRLARLRDGDRVLLLGPLGQAFSVSSDRPVVCIAGGVGLAPFLFLAAEQRKLGRQVRLLYGERTADRVFSSELIEELTGVAPIIYTEDGSAGHQGLVLAGIRPEEEPALLACGPTPMLQAVARLAIEHGLPLQVSVEEHMGCGIGTCQGCVVRSASGEWIKSCTEGPVFDARELSWPT